MLVFLFVKAFEYFGYIKYDEVFQNYEFASILVFLCCFTYVGFGIRNGQIKEKIAKRALENILDKSCLVSKTDEKGRIIEVNELFCKVSGYKPQELLGHDHSMLNSGTHPKQFWADMYKTTVKFKSIWNDTVVNKRKDGSHYIVKSWIMGNFDNRGKLIGFTSVRQDITKLLNSLKEVDRKNSYLEHAAKILRHDMHSGINTYIPRGLSSLKRRIDDEKIKELRIESPIKLLEEGLHHAQKVYEGVKEFTNLVKDDVKIHKETYDLKNILEDYLRSTSYKDRVKIDELGKELVNRSLFCTAVDNLIRNGLKYNDHPTKLVEIYKENGDIIIKDNGRGMTPEEFEELKKPYVRKNNKEKGTGLGLNICSAILGEHGFSLSCERVEEGTKLKITFNK